MATSLPMDLIARGYTLIERTPGRMFAVSPQWGCTQTLGSVDAVVQQARGLVTYLDWRSRRRQIANENEIEDN